MDEIQQLEFKITQVEARLYTWKRKVRILEIDSNIDERETDKMLDEISELKKRIEKLKKK
ncbi:acyltransferase [Parabacteroides pacaensis]|uniref:acyltransferase n=1 Tax=Parabacteroides pacaensis TaxID=2086575 RepID=UPI000D0EF99F|nr:acyltransferase [Parabacteroides pacaensis]